MTEYISGASGSHKSATLPSHQRCLNVASGDDAWTKEECEVRAISPRWLIREAECFITLSLVHSQPEWISARIQSAIRTINEIEDQQLRASALDYVATLLPEKCLVPEDCLAVFDVATASCIKLVDQTSTKSPTPPRAKHSTARRSHWLGRSLVALCLFFSTWLFLPGIFEPVDGVITNPREAITTVGTYLPDKSASSDFALIAHREYTFRATHLHPLKYQWLLHIDGRVRVVACSTSGVPLEYTWVENRFSRDFDCFIVVTSDRATSVFPENGLQSPEFANNVFSDDDIRTFILSSNDSLGNVTPEDALLKRARSALSKEFGTSRFRLQLCHVPYQD